MLLPHAEWDDRYPGGTGGPTTEGDTYRAVVTYLITALEERFRKRSDVYVSGTGFLYYERGNPRARVSPDVYVVFGVPNGMRAGYKMWCEGHRTPAVVIEVTSAKTQSCDMTRKLPIYERVLKVPECYFFDPRGDYVKSKLLGYRLKGDRYAPVDALCGRIHSPALGLDLIVQDELLRLYDPAAATPLPTASECSKMCEAYPPLDEIRAEIARLRASTAESRARTAQLNAENQSRQAEIDQLRAELALRLGV